MDFFVTLVKGVFSPWAQTDRMGVYAVGLVQRLGQAAQRGVAAADVERDEG